LENGLGRAVDRRLKSAASKDLLLLGIGRRDARLPAVTLEKKERESAR
jgi:hypothetical protein